MKTVIIAVSLLLSSTSLLAQANFFSSIKVEYEKTTSVRQLMKDLQENDSWYEQNKDRYPVSILSYYEFTGDTARSVYKPGKEVPVDPRMWWRPVADKNVVYNEYASGRTISQKPVFEETFLMEDSLLKIKWKITTDLRNIAGYECRKAIGLINDSITVFAFYSDELLINGGPEGLHGLPGMILGVGIPRLHCTWFATKVEVNGVNMKPVTPPAKGKKVTRTEMMSRLGKLADEWGTYGSKLLVNFVI
ncbi:MAG: GLPGLI family protein [Chitinophagaceae bacterium]|nr:GLPGLI family protein [Chitinophagaceae bacterium]